jgi:2-alkyl-3-oxoalkanoate reductase
MIKVAILGASGFIGSRAVEMLHLAGLADVRPVVRSVVSLARLSRFDLDCRVADALDEDAMRAAIAGCDVVVHAVAGDPSVILGSLEPTYRAAERAGISRFLYLSTASVHGQAPSPGTDEASPLNDRQPLAYNNAKVRAEYRLLELREKGSVQLTLLRPGIVFGPRSSWLTDFAESLLHGRAYLVDGARGICNSIYVDNLIHAMHRAMTADGVDREAFLLGDHEEITWSDLYRPIVEALGFELSHVPIVGYAPPAIDARARLKAVLDARPSQGVLRLLPPRVRRVGAAVLSALLEGDPSRPSSPWSLSAWESRARIQPVATLEMALLHRCRYKLPYTKATRLLGYEPIVSFQEACQRSIAWMAFAGYPVIDR